MSILPLAHLLPRRVKHPFATRRTSWHSCCRFGTSGSTGPSAFQASPRAARVVQGVPSPSAPAPRAHPGWPVRSGRRQAPEARRGRFYQFTAINEASRYRVLKIYAQSSIPNAIAFIDEVHRRLPVAIQRAQTEHGNDFGTDFNVASSRSPHCPSPRRSARRATEKSSAAIAPMARNSIIVRPSAPSPSSPPRCDARARVQSSAPTSCPRGQDPGGTAL